MLCVCIKRALMLPLRKYHLLYPPMVTLLKKYAAAVQITYLYLNVMSCKHIFHSCSTLIESYFFLVN